MPVVRTYVSLSDPNRPDEPHWIPLGTNAVRVGDNPLISIPDSVSDGGILASDSNSASGYRGYWSYERENGWILLGNQELTNSRNRNAEPSDTYVADENEGDFKPSKDYALRMDGSMQIPDMFFSSVENVEETLDTPEQVVPEQARIKDGELRYFMTWSEWLHSDPKVAVLFRMDRLPFVEPDEIPGSGGNTPGPQFGDEGVKLDPPDIGLSTDP